MMSSSWTSRITASLRINCSCWNKTKMNLKSVFRLLLEMYGIAFYLSPTTYSIYLHPLTTKPHQGGGGGVGWVTTALLLYSKTIKSMCILYIVSYRSIYFVDRGTICRVIICIPFYVRLFLRQSSNYKKHSGAMWWSWVYALGLKSCTATQFCTHTPIQSSLLIQHSTSSCHWWPTAYMLQFPSTGLCPCAQAHQGFNILFSLLIRHCFQVQSIVLSFVSDLVYCIQGQNPLMAFTFNQL